MPEPRIEKTATREVNAAQAKVDSQIDAILSARNSDPFAVLGPQPVATPTGPRWVIRFFDPHAYSASISGPGIPGNLEAQKRRSEGLFEVTLPETYKDKPDPSKYKIRYQDPSGDTYERYDTYAFPYLLSDFDLYLMGEGRHYDAYEKLGAHITTVAGVKGVNFAVWAPNARRVSIVGDFNHWDGRVHPMRARGSSGIWEFFIPELDEGAIYKYEIIGPRGDMLPLKADPYGFRAELRPQHRLHRVRVSTHTPGTTPTGSRSAKPRQWLDAPISIYEVHLGSWRRNPEEGNRWLTYRELADQLVADYLKDTRLHPRRAAADHGAPLRRVLGLSDDRLFRARPAASARPTTSCISSTTCTSAASASSSTGCRRISRATRIGLGHFDGTHLYEHADPRLGEHPDWGTLIFNYGRNEVGNFLIAQRAVLARAIPHRRPARGRRRLDALPRLLAQGGRVDAQRLRRQREPRGHRFLKRLNEVAYERYPGILTIAEESTSWPASPAPPTSAASASA